jgi:Mrp family chromosome partitioning ATPase
VARKQIAAHKRMLVVGRVRPAVINSMTNRYLVEIAHKFQGIQELLGHGRGILQNGSYDTVLIGSGLDSDRRQQLLNFLSKRQPAPTVGVLTTETSYGAWLPIDPEADADDIADRFSLLTRKEPAQVVVVSITKGGAGKSTVSTNTAITLAQMGYRVALIDDDPTSRSVRPLMGIDKDTPYTSAGLVAEIEANEGMITPEIVQKYLVNAHGVDCLVGAASIVSHYPVDVNMAKDVLAILGHDLGYDYVVIDAPPDIVNSSSFSYWLLKTTETSLLPPIVLVPVAPEKLVILSAEDTVAAVTHMGHPLDRAWPVISCTQVTHDARSLAPPHGNLWQPPAAVIPYCPDAKSVADTGRPFTTMEPGNLLRHAWRKYFLDVADVQDVQKAFRNLAGQIVTYAPRNEE